MAQEISLAEAHQQWQQSDPTPLFVDIRDAQSFAAGRIPGSQPLNNNNLAAFIKNTAATSPVIVVCYHGISSHQAADVLQQQGLSTVYSLQGGFTGWQSRFPDNIEWS